jgi:hypothetical protein
LAELSNQLLSSPHSIISRPTSIFYKIFYKIFSKITVVAATAPIYMTGTQGGADFGTYATPSLNRPFPELAAGVFWEDARQITPHGSLPKRGWPAKSNSEGFVFGRK